jgi:hypothetical protein
MRFFTVSACLIFLFSSTVVMADLTEGLIALWPLDDDANDIIGGHDGNLVGGASFVNDADRGKVLSVDGTDGRVEVPNAADLLFQPADSFSISVWLNIQTLPGNWSGVVTKSRDASPWYGLWVTPGNQWHFDGGDGGVNVRLDAGQAKTGWLHLAGVYDAGAHTQTVYEDGAVIGENTSVTIAASGAGDVWFGGAKSVSEFLDVLIDDVALYSRALTADEVQEIAAGTDITTAVEPDSKLTTTWGSIKK